MVKHEQAGGGTPSDVFSPELTRDIAGALAAYLLRYDAEADAELRTLTNRVCTEARTLGLPPEKMLIAIKHLFERIPLPEVKHSERRRQTFERFITGCIESCFDAGPR